MVQFVIDTIMQALLFALGHTAQSMVARIAYAALGTLHIILYLLLLFVGFNLLECAYALGAVAWRFHASSAVEEDERAVGVLAAHAGHAFWMVAGLHWWRLLI
jgi:hypothetical protein